MLLFKKLVDETQMPQSQNFRTAFKQILACIFLSVRDNSNSTFQYETPCIHIKVARWKKHLRSHMFYKQRNY